MEAISDWYEFLNHWLTKGYVIGDKMFIKTHAHSMHGEYDSNGIGYPHQHPLIIEIFERLQEVCDVAGADLKYSTVNQVMEELYQIDERLHGLLHEGPIEAAFVDSRRFSGIEGGIGRTYGRSKYQFLEDVLLRQVTDMDEWECLGRYYINRFDGQSEYFSRVDLVILQYCLMQFREIDNTAILEFGPGIGSGLLLLSISGFTCTGVEADRDRYTYSLTMKEVAADLSMEAGFEPGPLRYHYGEFPSLFPEFDEKMEKVLISTNVVSGHTANNHDEILENFSNFDHLIIDLGSFGIARAEEEKRKDLDEEITSLGFARKSQFFKAGRTNLVHYYRTD